MLLLFLPLAYSGEPNQTEPTEFIFMVQCVSLQQSNSTIKDSSSLTWVQVEDMNSCSCVSGLELTFYSGVYGTCIGAMTGFGQDAKSLIGISGIFIGVGEILGETPQPWTSSLTPGRGLCVILFFFFWSFLSLVRRGHIWVAEQEQPFWPEPCGSAWSHHSLCGLLLDFPQHREWRSARPRGRNR